jgi:hypothetical protein
MKQAEDNLTIEMYPELTEAVKGANYRFYIETPDGVEIEWCGLTRKQARDMMAYTNAHQPSNVSRSGWEITR